MRKFADVDDSFAGFQPFQNDVLVARLRAELHVARFEISVPAVYKSDLPRASLQNTARRNHKMIRPAERLRSTFTNIPGVRVRFGFREDQPDPRGASRHVHVGVDEIDSAVKSSARIGIDRQRSGLADLYSSKIVLKHLSEHPDGREICDGVQARIGLHGQVRQRISLGDVAGDRRIDFEFLAVLGRMIPGARFPAAGCSTA